MILSVLICSIKERAAMLEKLVAKLDNQRYRDSVYDDAEIVTAVDERTMSIGAKRNWLMRQSRGRYVCFVDDDDDVSDDYLKLIVEACRKDPDCVGIVGEILWRGQKLPFVHSIKHSKYRADEKGFYRPPNHLNPIKREIAMMFPFPGKNHAEDFDFAMALQESGMLQSEVMVPTCLYYYNPSENHGGQKRA